MKRLIVVITFCAVAYVVGHSQNVSKKLNTVLLRVAQTDEYHSKGSCESFTAFQEIRKKNQVLQLELRELMIKEAEARIRLKETLSKLEKLMSGQKTISKDEKALRDTLDSL